MASIRGVATNFICPECEHTWTMTADGDGLFDGYGNPRCPKCDASGCDPNDHGDFVCSRGHNFRRYGNGGLRFGMLPRCPDCGAGSIWA